MRTSCECGVYLTRGSQAKRTRESLSPLAFCARVKRRVMEEHVLRSLAHHVARVDAVRVVSERDTHDAVLRVYAFRKRVEVNEYAAARQAYLDAVDSADERRLAPLV